MSKTKKLVLKATPESEDFRGKYESGKAGNLLLNKYFKTVEKLTEIAIDDLKSKKIRAIEIGCGEGLSTQRIRNFLPEKVELEASEYVESQIAFAKRNNPGIKITQESIYELKHEVKSFDIIYLPEVLEHLDYPETGLKELHRVTSDGGYLIIGVPNEPLWRALNMSRGKYWNDWGNTPGHLNHWSSSAIKKLVENHFGTVIVKKAPIPWTILLAKKDARKKA